MRDVGEEEIDPLDLSCRERGGSRSITGNRVEMSEGRLEFMLDLLGNPFDPPGQSRGP